MSESSQVLGFEDAEQIKAAWKSAVISHTAVPQAANGAQALAFGVNLRISLAEALKAVWETAQAAIKVSVTAHAHFDPWAWLDVSAEVVNAIRTIISSLVERMAPIDYVTAVILSTHPNGLGEADLRNAVLFFLKDSKSFQLAWYLGMSKGFIERAQEVADPDDPEWFQDTLRALRNEGFVSGPSTSLTFQQKNFEIGWK